MLDILLALGLMILGLILLTYGGNTIIDASVSIAKRFKISEAIIGLTIVAIGTSMPELAISIVAGLEGKSEIVIGNILGSNIANVFLILGITAIIHKIHFSKTTRFFDLPNVIFATFLLLLVVSDRFFDGGDTDIISRSDGILFLIFAFVYIVYSLRHNNIVPNESIEVEKLSSGWKIATYLIGSIGVIFLGGKFLVDGAIDLAKMIGLSESIISLTIIAVGTSAPEFVTSIIAARRGRPELAIGNIVGSGIMNILVILGMSSIIVPIPFPPTSYFDLSMVFMAPLTLLFLTTVSRRREIGRKQGVFLVLIYFLYLWHLLMNYVL